MSNEQLIDILTKFNDFLHISNMMRDSARSFLDWIVSILLWIVNNISGILYETTKFLEFYKADSMGDKGLFSTLGHFQKFGLGISILLIGAVLSLGKTSETREVPLNFLMMLMITLMLPDMMGDGVKIINATTDSLKADQGELGFKTFKDNLTDVYVLADNGWTTTNPDPPNYLADRDNFDINEKIVETPEGENGDPLKNKLIDKKGGEGKEVAELEDGDGGIFGWITKNYFAEKYYRWQVNWVSTIGTLVALSFALIISILRACRVSIEMGFDYIWANIIAYFSVRDVKKLKMALMSLLGGFVLLLSIFTMYYVFINWNTYIFQKTDVSNLTKIMGLVAGAWFIYDGPAIIQKTLGIDAGLSTAGAFLMTAGGAKAMKGATDVVKGVTESAANNTVRTAGLFSGLFSDNKKNSEDSGVNSEMEEEKNRKEQENEYSPENKEDSDKTLGTQQKESTNQSDENEENMHDSMNEEEFEETSDSTELTPNENVLDDDTARTVSKETAESDVIEEETIQTEEDAKNAPNKSSTSESTTEELENGNTSDENVSSTSSLDQEEQIEKDKTKSQSLKEHKDMEEAPDENKNQSNDSSKFNSVESSTMKKNDSPVQDQESQTINDNHLSTPNPFKKRMSQVIHRSKYENQSKNYVGQQVDRFNRNKEFGQDIREWLKERKITNNEHNNDQERN